MFPKRIKERSKMESILLRPTPKLKQKGLRYELVRIFLIQSIILGDGRTAIKQSSLEIVKDLLPAIQTYQKTLDKLTGDKLDKIFKEKIFDLGEE
jgi:hypothetical protein